MAGCTESDGQLSSLAQICNPSLSLIFLSELIYLYEKRHSQVRLQGNVEIDQWPERIAYTLRCFLGRVHSPGPDREAIEWLFSVTLITEKVKSGGSINALISNVIKQATPDVVVLTWYRVNKRDSEPGRSLFRPLSVRKV